MWTPRRLTTPRAFTACYKDSFTYFLTFGQEAEWARESTWTLWVRKKSCTAGNRTQAYKPRCESMWDVGGRIKLEHSMSTMLLQDFFY
jgi:hypothetical protein